MKVFRKTNPKVQWIIYKHLGTGYKLLLFTYHVYYTFTKHLPYFKKTRVSVRNYGSRLLRSGLYMITSKVQKEYKYGPRPDISDVSFTKLNLK